MQTPRTGQMQRSLSVQRLKAARQFWQEDRPAEAYQALQEILALDPGFAAAQGLLRTVVQALETADPHLSRLQLMAVAEPLEAGIHLDLGSAYLRRGRTRDAARHFETARALGRVREAGAELARMQLRAGHLKAARDSAEAALGADADHDPEGVCHAIACEVMADLAALSGDGDGRRRWLDRAYAEAPVFVRDVAGSPFTTLVLTTVEQGNLSLGDILPDESHARAVWTMDYARPDQFTRLPPHQVVLNAIGDPDHIMASLPVLDAFCRQSERPVLNAPARILATARDRLGATLDGIDGVLTPRTLRCDFAALSGRTMTDIRSEFGLELPLILRPAGTHGGEGMARIDSDAFSVESWRAGQKTTFSDVYLTQYVDYRSADGHFRKYRMMFIDRTPYPYHLAIGRNWVVHHDTADMTRDRQKRAEELAFLADPEAALGRRALDAIGAIARRIDLDYAGIDFALSPTGEVIVFEANAPMVVHRERSDGPFAAKAPYIATIIDAFQRHLAARAAE